MNEIADSQVSTQFRGERGIRATASDCLRGVMEAVLLLLICATPWVYGAVHPGFEFLLDTGIFALLVLWGIRFLLDGKITWKRCPVAACLACLFLLGLLQITPLPNALMDRISPGATTTFSDLLPSQTETLPEGTVREVIQPPPGSTLSLYADATRKQVFRIAAVFLVFGLVRSNLASRHALRRLCFVVLVNGTALAVFALIQHFSSPPHRLYWSYDSMAEQVFGPFVCRNHFPFYLNVCIGMGLGLLMAHRSSLERRASKRGGKSERDIDENAQAWWTAPLQLLRDPASMWMSAGLAFMLGSVVLCLSRGGFVALAGAGLVCLLFRILQKRREAAGGAVLIAVAFAVVLAGLFGFSLVTSRVASLGKKDTYQDRLELWSRLLPVIGEFPACGTGFGTFAYVEPLHRTDSKESSLVFAHAHNDYLELLVEGGAVGLVLGLVALGMVVRLGLRALRRHAGDSTGGLALGALFAFSSLAIHGFMDFGNHVPAITLLSTVLAAQLCGLTSSPASNSATVHQESDLGARDEYHWRFFGLAPVAGAAALTVLGWLLCNTAWKTHRADRFQWEATQFANRVDPKSFARQTELLERACQITPGDAGLRSELGKLYMDRYEREILKLDQNNRQAGWTELGMFRPALLMPGLGVAPVSVAAPAWSLATVIRKAERHQLGHRFLVPGLKHFLHARDLCPLLSEPHLAIASHVDSLVRSDSRQAYLNRAKILAGGKPEVWFECGYQEFLDDHPADAWQSWRRCLELSHHFLAAILKQSRAKLSADEILDRVLPDRPDLLLQAAMLLFPQADAIQARKPFLTKALTLLELQDQALTAQDWLTKARIHRSLDQPGKSLAAFGRMIQLEPNQVAWRLEYANVLFQQGLLREAHGELLVILHLSPNNPQAMELKEQVEKEAARPQKGP